MEQEIMSIILNAGDARSKSLLAFREARKGNYEKANEYLKNASESMSIAHKLQTTLIQKEITGEPQEVSMLMVHAQDHLMNAMTIRDMAIEFIEFAKEVKKGQQKQLNKILFACAGGFSTSMLVHKMKKAAEERGLTVEILAVSEDNIRDHLNADVLLLGPQIEHKLEIFSKAFDFPVYVVDMTDYGMMNGEKVLTDILEKVK